ncbi:MAG: hypothetical protein R3C99_15320 [Pirellulaceae bacterium]
MRQQPRVMETLRRPIRPTRSGCELEQQRVEAEQARLADAAERAAAADRLKTIGVAVVLTSGQEAMAAIGQKFVKVGDVIDGWKVMAIQENGTVLLKPAE